MPKQESVDFKEKDELEARVKAHTAELAQANIRLRKYISNFMWECENEKKRIARDLHDQIGQSLTALKLIISRASRSPGEQANQLLTEAQSALSELMGQVREMSLDLHPSMLDDLGLLPTLEWYKDRFEKQTGRKVILSNDRLEIKLNPEVAETAYRIIQEALTNTSKHSEVKEDRVDIQVKKSRLCLRVETCGKGFDFTKTNVNGSYGLLGIQARLSLLGGNLKISTKSESEVIISAEIPLNSTNDKFADTV